MTSYDRRIAYYDRDLETMDGNSFDDTNKHTTALVYGAARFIPSYPHEPVTDIDVPSKCAFVGYGQTYCGRDALAYDGDIVANVTQEIRWSQSIPINI